jgi:hypothetical protein
MEAASSNAEGHGRRLDVRKLLTLGDWKNVAMPSYPLLLTSTNVPRAEAVESARCWCWVMIVEVEGAEGLEIRGPAKVRSVLKITKTNHKKREKKKGNLSSCSTVRMHTLWP